MNEIHFRLHHRHVVLRSPLQHKACAQRREIGNAGYVEEHVLGEHGGQTCQDFLGTPTLTLEVHDVGLHEHGATVAKHRHRLSGEGEVGILFDAQPEPFRSRLEKVSIAGGALRIQFEIFHPAIVKNDDLDILPTHVDDHVRIFIELERRLRVSHGLDQSHVGVQDVFQNIFGVAGGGDSQDLELGILRFDLSAQILEHLDRVLDRVAVRELVGLAQDVTAIIQQYGLGGSRPSVDADEAADGLAFLERCWRKLLPTVGFFEAVEFAVS